MIDGGTNWGKGRRDRGAIAESQPGQSESIWKLYEGELGSDLEKGN